MTDKPKFKLRSKTKPMSRIDIIGSNGSTGEHYTEIKEYYIGVDMANGEDYSGMTTPFFEKSYLDQKRQMMEENERSEVFGKWISVEDRLPELNKPVLVRVEILFPHIPEVMQTEVTGWLGKDDDGMFWAYGNRYLSWDYDFNLGNPTPVEWMSILSPSTDAE